MGKDGYSRKGFWGQDIHYDKYGNKVGESWRNFWGEKTHYDNNGNVIGSSTPKFSGGYEHYDNSGRNIGSSEPNFWGGKNHYDSSGRKTGSSIPNFWNGLDHYDETPSFNSGYSSYNRTIPFDPYAWRKKYESDSDASVDVNDYETEEEYLEDRFGWREEYEFDFDASVDVNDYETEDDYLNERFGWRKLYKDDFENCIYVDDYETEEDFLEALKDAKDLNDEENFDWASDCDWLLNYEPPYECGLSPFDYKNEEDYLKAISEIKNAWKKKYSDPDVQSSYFDTEEKYLRYKEEERKLWQDYHREFAEKYNLDMDAYATEADFEKALETAKNGWREKYKKAPLYDLNPDDYDDEEDYLFYAEQERHYIEAKLIAEKIRREIEQGRIDRIEKRKAEEAEKRALIEKERAEHREIRKSDKTINIFCLVKLNNLDKPFYYLTKDESLLTDDFVVVPFGENNKEFIGKIISIEKHTGETEPFPADKAKYILRKANAEEIE